MSAATDTAAPALLAPVPSATSPEEETARCPRHAHLPVAGTCGRCGTFYCIECVPDAATRTSALCPDCEASREVREAPERIDAILRELTGSLVVLAILMVAMPLPVLLIQDKPWSLSLLVPGLIMALPFALSAALIWTKRRMWAVWLGFVFETAVMVVLLLSSNLITIPLLLLLMLYTLGRIFTLQDLLKLQAGNKAPAAAG